VLLTAAIGIRLLIRLPAHSCGITEILIAVDFAVRRISFAMKDMDRPPPIVPAAAVWPPALGRGSELAGYKGEFDAPDGITMIRTDRVALGTLRSRLASRRDRG